jgi:hypothetical protein
VFIFIPIYPSYLVQCRNDIRMILV